MAISAASILFLTVSHTHQSLDPGDWPAILFHGRVLAQSMKGISILVSEEGLPSSAGDWIWRFVHCKNLTKTGAADWCRESAEKISNSCWRGDQRSWR